MPEYKKLTIYINEDALKELDEWIGCVYLAQGADVIKLDAAYQLAGKILFTAKDDNEFLVVNTLQNSAVLG